MPSASVITIRGTIPATYKISASLTMSVETTFGKIGVAWEDAGTQMSFVDPSGYRTPFSLALRL